MDSNLEATNQDRQFSNSKPSGFSLGSFLAKPYLAITFVSQQLMHTGSFHADKIALLLNVKRNCVHVLSFANLIMKQSKLLATLQFCYIRFLPGGWSGQKSGVWRVNQFTDEKTDTK